MTAILDYSQAKSLTGESVRLLLLRPSQSTAVYWVPGKERGKLPLGLFFSFTLGRKDETLILAHKSKVVFQGLKILLFLNYNYAALLWHWKTFMTAIKVRWKLMD